MSIDLVTLSLGDILIGQRNVRLTSNHEDGCLMLWSNASVNNFSVPRSLHKFHRTITINTHKKNDSKQSVNIKGKI